MQMLARHEMQSVVGGAMNFSNGTMLATAKQRDNGNYNVTIDGQLFKNVSASMLAAFLVNNGFEYVSGGFSGSNSGSGTSTTWI